jgi:hypothetical protein
METSVMPLISYTGFLVPLGHGSVIQPSCATLGGLFLGSGARGADVVHAFTWRGVIVSALP